MSYACWREGRRRNCRVDQDPRFFALGSILEGEQRERERGFRACRNLCASFGRVSTRALVLLSGLMQFSRLTLSY